ncbi:D-2-hydroxyacid dehydrogenase [Auritidibacter sp. NML100628]|uniref:D-2-hydroxyacid dehydrogenase n=1 Tax=Auritidibacter sp. NML100628 TaxID=2170742 RepID=UPI000D7348D4|nr:D-2-hydroxyacid dehydrogenase [Auritidibacter sp. NML100628]PXA76856.1 hydroxyacid dehydrogenase [Auritidibacter sp. NML100628]
MSQSRAVLTILVPSDREHPSPVPAGLERIEDRAEVRLSTAEQLPEKLPGAHGLLLWDFFSDALQNAWHTTEHLQWIHVAAAGVDTLLFDELRDSEVTVTNAQGIFDRPIAEWVLGAILAEAKDFADNYRLKTTKSWKHRETTRVAGAKALVIGTGAIGREIARMLRAAGLNVTGAGRRARDHDEDFGEVVLSEDLIGHVGEFDVMINAAPLTPATTGLIDAEVLAAVKPGAHVINIGRGPSVDEPALITALRDGPLGFASLDVFTEEPLPQTSELWELDNVMISSHMSGDVTGWREALAEQFLDNAERWLADQPLHNVVDKTAGYVPGVG